MARKLTIYLLNLVLILVTITGCMQKAKPKDEMVKEEVYIPVKVEKAEKKTLYNTTTFTGLVYPEKDIMVVPKIFGNVSKVNIEVGSEVKKGDILFTIDRSDLEKQVEQAKAALDTAKVNYELTKEKIENAKINFERTKKLYEEGAVSKSQFEQAQLAASDKSLEIVKTQLDQAELAYNQALDALKDAYVKSPIDGIVSSLNVEEGEMVTNTQPAVTIIDIDKVYVQISVTEDMINSMHIGQEVSVKIPSATKENLIGKISAISPSSDSRTQLYPVKIYIENKEHKIKPGMFAEIEINTDVKEDCVTVESQAVLYKNGKNVLYVVENGKAVEKEVTLGIDTGVFVEIVEGIKEGEDVIVQGQSYVENGTSVKIVRGE